MIKTQSKPYRQTTAQWTVCEGDQEREEAIRVQYYPLTVKDLKESKQVADDETTWLSDLLVKRLHALPDLVGEDDKPVAITIDFLDIQAVSNLRKIFEAITDHENPKSTGDSSPEK